MIELKNRIETVDLHLYGSPIVANIADQVATGLITNLVIPLQFDYNCSWKVQHICYDCGAVVFFGLEYDGNSRWNKSYCTLKYLCSKYYVENFLIQFTRLFDDIIVTAFEGSLFVHSGLFDANFPVTSSLQPLYYKCLHCQAEYIGRFRQGFPEEPDKANWRGRLGIIVIDGLIGVKVENSSFEELVTESETGRM